MSTQWLIRNITTTKAKLHTPRKQNIHSMVYSWLGSYNEFINVVVHDHVIYSY